MKVTHKTIDSIKPYENNPRINDGAVDAVAASLKINLPSASTKIQNRFYRNKKMQTIIFKWNKSKLRIIFRSLFMKRLDSDGINSNHLRNSCKSLKRIGQKQAAKPLSLQAFINCKASNMAGRNRISGKFDIVRETFKTHAAAANSVVATDFAGAFFKQNIGFGIILFVILPGVFFEKIIKRFFAAGKLRAAVRPVKQLDLPGHYFTDFAWDLNAFLSRALGLAGLSSAARKISRSLSDRESEPNFSTTSCALSTAEETVNAETGWARQKFEKWWRQRCDMPAPTSVEEAVEIAEAGGIAEATQITVRSISGEKFDKIIDYVLGPIPPRLDGKDEYSEEFNQSDYSWAGDEIPF